MSESDVERQAPFSLSQVDGVIAAEGRYSLQYVPPGKHTVWAQQYVSGDSSQNFLALARRDIEVGTEDMDGVDLTLEPPHHLEGMVVFETGCAPETVQINLQGDSGYISYAGTDGQFVLQNVWPGKYKISASGESRNTTVSSVKLGDAEIPADGFELKSETKGPLRITMRCSGR